MTKVNDDGSITLYLPDNATAKEMIKNYIGNEDIQTNLGNLTVQNIIFYQGNLELNTEVTGTIEDDTLSHNSEMSLKYTLELYNNFLKQNTPIPITKQDNIYDYLKIQNSLNFKTQKVA